MFKSIRRDSRHDSKLRPLTLWSAAGMAAACLVSTSSAGGTPENALIVIDPSNAGSMYIGNYYKNARNIPDSNVIYVDPDSIDYATWQAEVLPGMTGHLANRRLGDHIDYIIATPSDLFYINATAYISDGCAQVRRFSMSSVWTLAQVTADINARNLPSTWPNRYYTSTSSAPTLYFDSNQLYNGGVAVTTGAASRKYYIGAMLGWTDPVGTAIPLGNTAPQIAAMIDRSVSADGTFPTGNFYFMNNTADPIRNVRACGNQSGCLSTSTPGLYNSADTLITNLGGSAEVINGITPVGKFDALGVMTGDAWPAIEVDNSIWSMKAGSFADHLTSFAGNLDYNDQRKVSAWIRKGASASAGTVEEPCNYLGKFPVARFHVYYFQGMSIGESYLRSMQYAPFQSLLYGDPLTRPFSHIPSVNATGIPGGAASGTVNITPSATTSRPSTTITSYELLIDGVLTQTVGFGESFSFNTEWLADGYHDVRVLAYDSSTVRNVGRFVTGMTTSNAGKSATLTPGTPSGDLSTAYSFTLGASGGAIAEARLLVNGKVAATRTSPGAVIVGGQSLGAGTVKVQSEVLFADGSTARSAPSTVSIAYTPGTPSGAAPTAFSYTKFLSKASPSLVELPASLDSDPSGAVFTIVTPPSQATLAGPARGCRLLTPNAGACGTDTIVYNVTTSAGTSANATVTIVYTNPPKACPADLNDDGFVDAIDYDTFITSFVGGLPAADFNNDCFPDAIDYDMFINMWLRACP